MEGGWRGTIKPAHTVNSRHCYVLHEEAWIYEAEPDWVVNLMRWAWPRPRSLSSQDALVHALGKGDARVKGNCSAAPQACKYSDGWEL